jgi:hypothetical protein
VDAELIGPPQQARLRPRDAERPVADEILFS